jgi:hypothetical protein
MTKATIAHNRTLQALRDAASGEYSRAGITREIQADWEVYCRAVNAVPEAYGALPKGTLTLLGTSVKTRHESERTDGYKVTTKVLYMSPADTAFTDGTTLCPLSGWCQVGCISETGMLGLAEQSKLWKSVLYKADPRRFTILLVLELAAHARKAEKEGMTPAVRVDGTSDTGLGRRLAVAIDLHPDTLGALRVKAPRAIMFYDYTKIPFKEEDLPANYSLTYSYSENDLLKELPASGNIAVVFDTEEGRTMPEWVRGLRVVSGDVNDNRFLDWTMKKWYGEQLIIGLTWKKAVRLSNVQNVEAANTAVSTGFAIRGCEPGRPRRASIVCGERDFHKTSYFSNGYAASVVADPKEPYIEVAILNGRTRKLDYTTHLTGDVKRLGSWLEVSRFKFEISNLPTLS